MESGNRGGGLQRIGLRHCEDAPEITRSVILQGVLAQLCIRWQAMWTVLPEPVPEVCPDTELTTMQQIDAKSPSANTSANA